MFWFVTALAIAVLTAVVIGYMRHRSKRAVSVIVAHDLGPRIRDATKAFKKAAAWQPASAGDAPEAAAAIEAALIAREPRRALELAELALVAGADSSARVWLAWALCASGQPIAALDQLQQIDKLDGDGARALAKYITARAEHLKFEHGVGSVEAVPPLITAADVAVVTLARGRGGAAWLTGGAPAHGNGGDAQLSALEVRAAVGEHREITGRCLEGALAALALQPGFADAAYLTARLAVKAGFVDEAASMFDAIAPRMVGRPELETFERDRRDLVDPTTAVANARIKPAAPSAKRSRSLKVL